MEKLQVRTDTGWVYVMCAIGTARVETTELRKNALPRNCPELAHAILSEFEETFPDREFRLVSQS